ncbi:MAG: DNA methylase [Clostridiales bacterium]|nr:DNA methylase [Clostridiales bacterium]
MKNNEKSYIVIDLKSFYASVECVDRGMDPLNTNLVVADESRTDKTICLAVSPALKEFGVPGRPRLFEVIQKVNAVNRERLINYGVDSFIGSSYKKDELLNEPLLKVNYIIAPPRMSRYMAVSNEIFKIYLKYISPEDIHVYSVDEVFIDATPYLKTMNMTARELAQIIIKDILENTGVTATAGIGTNLYLCKIALDIEAKHIKPDENGVRIAYLDEQLYRSHLWSHEPLTDFWRIGSGYSKKLNSLGLFTMGDIARFSLNNSDRLYQLFGINAELLIDHAWGFESAQMSDIKAYRSQSHSLSSGQVLPEPYTFEKGRLIVKEMTDALSLELVGKRAVSDQIVLTVGYDNQNVNDGFKGEIKTDRYGRKVPVQAHGSINLGFFTSSSKIMIDEVINLYDKIVDPALTIRRLNIAANHVISENDVKDEDENEQLNFFVDFEEKEKQKAKQKNELSRERRRQQAIIDIKKKYGKNAILKGMNYEDGATAIERNNHVGGHKA